MGVMGWLIDNCGFSFSFGKVIEIPCISCLSVKKDGVRFLDDYAVEFTSTNKYYQTKTVIHFSLYGNIGMKVYDNLKILVDNYEADNFFYDRFQCTPDFSPDIIQFPFRRQCAIEKFRYLLNRSSESLDLTQSEDLFYFVCDTLSYAYQYVSSYSSSLNLDAQALYQQAAVSDNSSTSQLKSFIAYVFFKKQYINAKKGLPLDLKKSKRQEAFGPRTFLLMKEHTPKELKYMYKRAKNCYLAEKKSKGNVFLRAMRVVVSNDRVKRLLRWVQTDYLEKWLLDRGQDVGFLLMNISLVCFSNRRMRKSQ